MRLHLFQKNDMMSNPIVKLKAYSKKTFKGLLRRSGRNAKGRITVRHRGGGWKRKYKIVDYHRNIWNIPGIIISLERSTHHSAYIAWVVYTIGISSYILAPQHVYPGDCIISGYNVPNDAGNLKLLRQIPLNRKISLIEAYPGSGATYIRAAGTWAIILEKSKKTATLLFSSGRKKTFSLDCAAVLGPVSNALHRNLQFKNAGHRRVFGWRPSVRGVAMNPVDHPHGGGRGKNSPNEPNYNFIRRLPKGRKTVKKKHVTVL